MLSNSQEDNLRIVQEADNETEETITHNNNYEINPSQYEQNNNQRKQNINRYPQAKYSYIDQKNQPQSKNQNQREMLIHSSKSYSNPENNEQSCSKIQNNWDIQDVNERSQNPRSILMNDDEDELQKELKNTQKSLQRLKQQQEYVTTSKFYSQKVTDTLPYQTYRDTFIQEKHDIRHNLDTPEELVVKTPNNYKRVKKNFYDTSKQIYNQDSNKVKTFDEAILNNLEEKSMIQRIQRDINREKADFLKSYQRNHYADNNQDQKNISPQFSDSSINDNPSYNKNLIQKVNSREVSVKSDNSIGQEEKIEKKEIQQRIDKLKTKQLIDSQPQTLDHYPHSSSNQTPTINNPADEVDKYNYLVYPESYKEVQQQMQESSIPRQTTPPNYKEIYLEKQDNSLFYPGNSQRDTHKEKKLIDKLSSSFNIIQSIKEYKQQKEALKATLKNKLNPSTINENFNLTDLNDFQQEMSRQTPKSIQNSSRLTPNQYNQQKYNKEFDSKRRGYPKTELGVDKKQLNKKRNSIKSPYYSFVSETPLTTRNQQKRDMNEHSIFNNELPQRMSISTKNSQTNQRYSSQPRSSKIYQQMDNFMNPRNSFEKPNNRNTDESGICLNTRTESQQGAFSKKLINQSGKKPSNNILSLDMSGIGNLDDTIQMQSARVTRKNNDLRTQSVNITPRDSTKNKLFREIDTNQNDYSQKKDCQRNFIEPQIQDYSHIDRKYKINSNSYIESLNNSRIDSDLSNRNILQKPILYPSRRLPSLNKSKNELYDQKYSNDKRQKQY